MAFTASFYWHCPDNTSQQCNTQTAKQSEIISKQNDRDPKSDELELIN